MLALNKELFTAPTYDTYTRVGEPFEKNGRLYAKVRTSCWKCGGSGQYAWFGVCYRCNGSGVEGKEVRLYTAEEREKYIENQEKIAARKLEKREQEMADRRATAKETFYEKNGFDKDGITFMALGDTFACKDILKAQGYKFNSLLNWHGVNPTEVDGVKFIPVNFDTVYEVTHTGYVREKEDAYKTIEDVKNENVISTSNFIGEVKDKFKSMAVKVKHVSFFEGKFGLTYVYTFEDKDGNVLNWFASKCQEIESGDEVFISGTIKSHEVYKGVKTTYITRCKIEC